MLNDKGEIAECTGDNVFILSKGVLLPPPDAGFSAESQEHPSPIRRVVSYREQALTYIVDGGRMFFDRTAAEAALGRG